jgi:hypothetical protein
MNSTPAASSARRTRLDGLERAAILISGTDHHYSSTGGIADLSVSENLSANSASLAQFSASRSQKALSSALIVKAASWRHSSACLRH